MPSAITFGPYTLDPGAPRLQRGEETIHLQPRPLAVLCYLAERRGVVVPRDELIQRLWAGTAVTKAVLKVAVRAVREALGDDADAPRFIETVGREGYRFIADGAVGAPGEPAPANGERPVLVGRAADLARLHGALARADGGARQVAFVTGEAGIGKTTLIDRFLAEVGATGAARVARGQCLEQYGEGEAYLPVLEAIGGLATERDPEVAEALCRSAPTWAAQLPALDGGGGAAAREAEAGAAMPARMLREMADALEHLTRRRTLVLVLEDLQWSDRSTVDLLLYAARRRQPARLLVVGSIRLAQATLRDHPVLAVKKELRASGACEELELDLLTPSEVRAYVGERFDSAPPAGLDRLAAQIHARTEGNALFMVNVANDLLARGVVARRDGIWAIDGAIEGATDHVPAGLQDLLERRMASLAPEVRRTLETASVAGDEFTVAAVAAALDRDAAEIEELCEALDGQGALIAEAGVTERPDGSVSGRYRFRHALYRRVLYDGIAASRRVRLHRSIGLHEEAAFGPRAGERASELAMHFTCGRDHARALDYHARAAAAALDRQAPHEAVAHFDAALTALEQLPAGTGRGDRELELVVASATLLMAVRGYAAPETERAFARARALADASPPGAALYSVLRGLVSYHHVRGELSTAYALSEQLLRHAAGRRADRPLRIQAHYGHGATLFHMGRFRAAHEHLEAALGEYEAAMHREHVLAYGGYDPGVACGLWLAWTLLFLGRIDEAREHGRRALELARSIADPFSLAWAHYGAGTTAQLLRDWSAAEALSAEAVRLADEHGFPHVLGMATIDRGWALLMQRKPEIGIPIVREGIAAVEATGARLLRSSYLGMLATVDAIEGHHERARERLDEALDEVERSGERLHEVSLLIARSHVLAADDAPSAAESSLRRALAVAREQEAPLLELRAATALARHCRNRDRAAEARAILRAAHTPFAGAEPAAPDVAAARRLLEELGVARGARLRRPRR